ASQADVRHADWPFAAAACVFRQRRTRHPRALPALPCRALSRRARTRRYAAVAELSAHRPHLGRGARDRRGAAQAVAWEPAEEETTPKAVEERVEEEKIMTAPERHDVGAVERRAARISPPIAASI